MTTMQDIAIHASINQGQPVTTYSATKQMQKQLDDGFHYHSPTADQAERYQKINTAAKAFAQVILENTPPSREQSLAFTELQQARMWSNASIAVNETI